MGLLTLDFPIHFQWICFKTGQNYFVTGIHYAEDYTVTLTLTSGPDVVLIYGSPRWIEFTLLLHSKNFTMPKSHGLRGIIKMLRLRRALKYQYEQL